MPEHKCPPGRTVRHHAGEDAIGREGRHGTESAGESILCNCAGHHRHILLGDAEADAAAQLIAGTEDAVDVLGPSGEDALHQVPGADIEESGVFHRPGEPRLAGLAGGDDLAFIDMNIDSIHNRPATINLDQFIRPKNRFFDPTSCFQER